MIYEATYLANALDAFFQFTTRGRGAFDGVGRGQCRGKARSNRRVVGGVVSGWPGKLPSGAAYGTKRNRYGVVVFGRLNHPANKHQRRAAKQG